MKIYTHPLIYRPSDDTFLMADVLQKMDKAERAVELGFGTGLLSLITTRTHAEVWGYDTNPTALRIARKNAQTNGIARTVKFMLGDGKTAPRADTVIANPPYVAEEGAGFQDVLATSWNGGPDGLRTSLAMLTIAASKLKSNGTVLLLASSNQDLGLIETRLHDLRFRFHVAAKRKCFYEELFVYRCTSSAR